MNLYDHNVNYKNRIDQLKNRKIDLLNQILGINQKIEEKTLKIQEIEEENQKQIEKLRSLSAF